MHVAQAEIAAGVAVGEFFVVEAEQTNDRGVRFVHVHGRVISELLCSIPQAR